MSETPPRYLAGRQPQNQSPDLGRLGLVIQAQTRRIDDILSVQQKMLEHLIALAHAVDELSKAIPKPRAKPKRKPGSTKDRHPLTRGRSPNRLAAKQDAVPEVQETQEPVSTGPSPDGT